MNRRREADRRSNVVGQRKAQIEWSNIERVEDFDSSASEDARCSLILRSLFQVYSAAALREE